MSRSVKKYPVWSDQRSPGSGWAKRQASKAVRPYTRGSSDGKWYRKVYCPWNICDYSFYKTKQQAIQEWETSDWRTLRKPTLDEVIQNWSKYYLRK